MRRIDAFATEDMESFEPHCGPGLSELVWTVGRNRPIDYRWGASNDDRDRVRAALWHVMEWRGDTDWLVDNGGGRNLPGLPRPENIHNSRCHEARIAVPYKLNAF